MAIRTMTTQQASTARGPRRVAVVGAGLMGHGIAQHFAQKGCSVALCDVSKALLKDALEKIRSNLCLMAQADPGRARSADAVLGAIETTTDIGDAVCQAQFVIEAVPEDLDLKIRIFNDIADTVGDEVILASNTSTLSIAALGASICRRDRLIITHWFNPPYLIPVVEVVAGEFTGSGVMAEAIQFLADMGKEPVRVLKQVPGLLVNRIQTAMFREIVGLLEAGVASAEDIDKAVRGSMGLRLALTGPLATVDCGGVHVWHAGTRNLYPNLDASQKPQSLLEKMLAANARGITTGKGFFNYPPGSTADIIRRRDLGLVKLLKAVYPNNGKGDA